MRSHRCRYFCSYDRESQVESETRGFNVAFEKADAQDLPFDANTFDAAISECTTCILDKKIAIREMARVTKHGRYVGIHDLCWKENTPERLKLRLAELEGEHPETLHDWKYLFERIGLEDVRAADKSFLMPSWGREIKRTLGIIVPLKMSIKTASKWGLGGLSRIAESARILQNDTGYGIIVGRKP